MWMKRMFSRVALVAVAFSALGYIWSMHPLSIETYREPAAAPTRWTTPGPHGYNLEGKMFTLSDRGGITFYSPSTKPPYVPSSYPTRWPYENRSYRTRWPYHTPSYRTRWPYPTPSYRTRWPYPTPSYRTRWPYPTPSYPTRRPYPTPSFPTRRPYPTPSYPTRRPYPTPSYPTRWPYPTPSYPTRRPYPTPSYPTRWPYPTPSYPTRWPYPTPSYPTRRPYPTPSYPTRWPYPTPSYSTRWPYPTPSYPPSPTAPAARGVSVCFRYVTDLSYVNQFFTLRSAGSYSNSLVLNLRSPNTFTLDFNQYSLYLAPNNKFHASSNGVWTSVCLTLDNEKKVAQVFNGSMMSIRKIMLTQFVWSGEPVMEFSNFNGQLTNVQVWDYPISYKDVSCYTDEGCWWPLKGSVLTWSSISYSVRGDVLLEASYEKMLSKLGNKKMRKKLLGVDKGQDGKNPQL